MNICVDNTDNLLAAWLNETSVICGFSAYKTSNTEQTFMRSVSNSTPQGVYICISICILTLSTQTKTKE